MINSLLGITLAAALCSMNPTNMKKEQVKTEPFSINTIFQSNMILQRNKNVKVFGYGGEVGKQVEVKYGTQTKTCQVTEKGWELYLDPMEGSYTGKDLIVTYDGSETKFTNVVVGEVLLCSGQSNMNISLTYISSKDDLVMDDYGTYDNYNKLRLINMAYAEADEPTIYKTERGNWFVPKNLDSCSTFSAYALTCGAHLQKMIDCPVGLIHASVGGSCIEEWIGPDYCNGFHSYASEMQKKDSRFYNGFIHTLDGFTIGDILWYQGEANSQPRMSEDYKKAFAKYVEEYRTFFNDDKLPIYVQQLVEYSSWCDMTIMRDDQWNFMKTYDGVYTICGIDTGSPSLELDPNDDIHSPEKWVLGERFAAAYAEANKIETDLPKGFSPEITGATIYETKTGSVIDVQTTKDGKLTQQTTCKAFEVLADGVWKEVGSKIKSGKINISVDYKGITAIKYAAKDRYDKRIFVYDDQGLPLAPHLSMKLTKVENPNPEDPEEKTESKGCGGSLCSTAAIASAVSLVGLAFAKNKKHKED